MCVFVCVREREKERETLVTGKEETLFFLVIAVPAVRPESSLGVLRSLSLPLCPLTLFTFGSSISLDVPSYQQLAQ